MDAQSETTVAQVKKVNPKEDAIRLLIAISTKQLTSLHDQYFQLQTNVNADVKDIKDMTVNAIRMLERTIEDYKAKLPGKIW